MATFWQDLRYACRMLVRQPGFAAVAVLSLALGIGANTAIFSLLNAVFSHPLPVSDPSRLVMLYTTDQKNPGLLPISRPNFEDYGRQVQAFAGVAGYEFIPLDLGSDQGSKPEVAAGQMVSGTYFSLLGVKPALGRFFLPEEDAVPDRNPVIVLGDALWRTRFGADPRIVGRTIRVNGAAFTVVGVAPASFTGIDTGVRVDGWVPMMMHRRVMPDDAELFDERRALMFSAFARLKPGVTVAQADAQVRAVGERLASAYPDDNKGRGGRVLPLTEAAINPNARGIFTLAGTILMLIVGLVLLIACANVANLLLARATARRREIAVRISLGASRWRLARQLMTESLLLALVAGALGLGVGVWARELLWSLRPPTAGPFVLTIGPAIDGRVLLFTLLLAIVTGLLFGLAPALRATRPDLVLDLKERSSQVSDLRGRFSLRKLLVVGQVALSFIALVGAGLFVRSLQNAERIDPGFRTAGVAVMNFNVESEGYGDARGRAFFQTVLDRVRGLPGVQHVALASVLPLGGGGLARTVYLDGQDTTSNRTGVLVLTSAVTPDYFQTLGIPLVRGRGVLATDRQGTPRVAVVSAAMAKRFWPDVDPIGQRFRFFGQKDPVEVVGIAADSKFGSLGEEPRACAYLALDQNHTGQAWLIAATSGDPEGALGLMRTTVQGLDPNLPLTGVATMAQVLDRSLWLPRMAALLLGAFGLLALVLAALGLYGVMAYLVTQRTQEIGVRMALGASTGSVRGLVMRQGIVLAATGIVLGTAAGFALARGSSGLLYGVSAFDVPTFATIPLVLVAVALLATFVPARRATRIDPMLALRND